MKPSRRPLQLETLENRLACAGNVTAVPHGKQLDITGGVAANFIVVTPTETGVQVRGLPFNGQFNASGDPSFSGPATTVNGASFKNFSGVSSISIKLNGGNDAAIVGIDETELRLGSLLIDTGAGRDYIFSENVKFLGAGALTIKTHAATGAAGQTEAGADKIVLADLHGSPSTKFSASTGGGADRLEMMLVSMAVTNIWMGNSLGYLVVDSCALGTTMVNMGAGAARDQAFFENSTLTSLIATFGGGNDALTIRQKSKITGLAKVNGGEGTDTLTISADSSVPNKQVTSF